MKTRPIILVIIMFFFALFMHVLSIDSSSPDIIDQTLRSSETDKDLNALIGGYRGYKAEFNVNDIKKDTLNFTIIYRGREKDIQIDYKAKNLKNGHWQLISSDTTIITE